MGFEDADVVEMLGSMNAMLIDAQEVKAYLVNYQTLDDDLNAEFTPDMASGITSGTQGWAGSFFVNYNNFSGAYKDAIA